MSRPVQLEFDWKYYGHCYVKQLEEDLRLERERAKEQREDVKFYRGKCERLELALASQGNAAQQAYETRTSIEARPPIERVEAPRRKTRQDILREWNSLSVEQQEEIEKTGKWDLEEVKNAGQ